MCVCWRGGQIHYNNPRGCHGPHRSVAADRGQRWTEHRKLSKKKPPEDLPWSEMCFCLHSNTPTAAATRGTRSNKAEREEGRGEGTLSKKEEKKEDKSMNVSKSSINVKLVEWWTLMAERHEGCLESHWTSFTSFLFCLVETVQPFLHMDTSNYTLRHVQLQFSQHITCICIILLSVTHNGCSER